MMSCPAPVSPAAQFENRLSGFSSRRRRAYPYQKGDKMPKYNKNQVIKFPGAIEDARLKTKTVGDETAKIITFTVATRYSKALHALIGELCGGTAAVEIGTHQMDLISAIDSATGEQVE